MSCARYAGGTSLEISSARTLGQYLYGSNAIDLESCGSSMSAE